MHRSLILGLVVSLTLVGCGQTPSLEENKTEFDANPITLAPLGEACGSKLETLCEEGFYCEYSNGKRTGICAQKDINENIKCDKNQEPVCALKNRQKLSYLNECEARRHKAEPLNEGLCKPLEVANSCGGEVLSVGNCNNVFNGFEYNESQNECVQVPILGCKAEIPFETLETCVSTCVEA